MRLVAVSDTHGKTERFRRVCEMQPSADLFLHLGDGNREVDIIRGMFPEKTFVAVRGNCDYSADPADRVLELMGVRVMLTHGHIYRVKTGLDRLIAEAKRQEVQAVFFGHTHIPLCGYRGGLLVVNPGSAERPRFGAKFAIADIEDGAIEARLVDIADWQR